MTTLQIYLLGSFQLIHDGQPVTTIHQARQQSLLAYLLLHRDTPHARRDIAFLFWPDVPEQRAFTNLRKALHRLRNALPEADSFLHIDTKTVGWQTEASFSLDVADFEQKLAKAKAARQAGHHRQAAPLLAAAIELYRGDLFSHCYDDWLFPLRERLRQQFIGALTQLGDWQKSQRNYPAAIRTAQRLLRHDPLHEATHRQLMQLHLLNGEPAEALRVYHDCTTLLQQELKVDPNPATREIYERVLAGTDRSFEPSSGTGQHLSLLPLIGRQREWQQLLRAWRAASRGPRCAIISGEAGIGRSRLAEELQLWAKQQGFTTARSRAYEAAGSLAYAPIVDWLRSDALQPIWQTLEPVWLAEIARLLPELLTQQPALPRPRPLNESWQRHRLFEALSRAVLQADPPLLLVLDDLQWCDQETLEWLGYLLRFDQQARLLVVGTVRIEEIVKDHPLTALWRDLRRAGLLTEIELGPLDAAETAALAEQIIEHPLESRVAEQLYRDTGGNPLFIVETVRAGPVVPDRSDVSPAEAALPPRIQAVIDFRLNQLSPPARELVNVAAVIGQAFTFEVLAAASSAHPETLVNALDEVWQRRIIREQDQGEYDFSHSKIRNIAYAGLSTARRRWLHQTVAQAMETVYQHNLDQVSSQIANHYERAGQSEKAVAYYWQAAQTERALGAWSETINLLRRGLALLKTLPDTPERAQQALNSLALLGSTFATQKGYAAPEAGEAYEQALALAPKAGETPVTILVQFGLGIYHFVRADLQAAQAIGEQLFCQAQAHHDPTRLKLAHHLLGVTRFHMGQVVEAKQHLEQSLAQPATQQAMLQMPDSAVANLAYLALACWYLGYPDQARRNMDQAVSLAKTRPDVMVEALCQAWATWLYFCLGQIDQARHYEQAGLAICRDYGLVYVQTVLTIFNGWRITTQQQTDSHLELMHQGLAGLRASGAEANLSWYLTLLAEAYWETGQIEAGLETMHEAIAYIQRTGEHFLEAEVCRLKGELLLALSGEPQDEVETCFRHALKVAHDRQLKSLELRAAMSLARLWQQQGKIEEAHTLLSERYAWFREGFDTHDLQAAKCLLEQFSPNNHSVLRHRRPITP